MRHLEDLLTTSPVSWMQTLRPRLRQFLRVQQRIVFVGVLISVLFTVLKSHVPLTFMGVCIFTIGNLMYFLQALGHRFHGNRPFPWNWVLYLPILAAGSFLSAFVAVALLRGMLPTVRPIGLSFARAGRSSS